MKKDAFNHIDPLFNYKVVKKIGSGLSAEVYQAQNQIHGRVSIKAINKSFYQQSFGKNLINNQIMILKKLDNQNILKLVEVVQKNNQVFLITNFYQEGDLQNYINKKRPISQKQAMKFMKDIVSGCIYLKSQRIIHRDLKPSNIFIAKNKAIIADFGFAVLENDTTLKNINAGSPLYMPLQSLSSKLFSQKSDIFALGIILYQILTGRTPWSAQTEAELKQKLKYPPKIQTKISNRVKQIIFKCLQLYPENRPTAEQLLSLINENEFKNEAKQKSLLNKDVNKQLKSDQQILKSVRSINQSKHIKKQNKQNLQILAPKEKKHRCLTINTVLRKEDNRAKRESWLNDLNPHQFLFLPPSLIIKLKYIVNQYKKVLGLSHQQTQFIQQSYVKDTLIIQIQQCKTQLQLCKVIQAFVRRLFRLTKNYRQYKKCFHQLQQLYNRVTSIII